jgi:arginase
MAVAARATASSAGMNIRLLLVPYDAGQRGWRAGRGPELLAVPVGTALERAGHQVDVETVTVEGPPLEVGLSFALHARLAAAVRAARDAGAWPLVLAGNCGSALGTVAGCGGGAGLGVVWFDGHGDFNTPETTPSGLLDGMMLAALTGRCWRSLAAAIPGFVPVDERRVVLAGARDLDPLEAAELAGSRVATVGVDALRGGGEGDGASLAAGRAALAAAPALYVHVDLDVLDGERWRANELASGGGLAPDEVVAAVGALGSATAIAAAALTAYDPDADEAAAVPGAAESIAVGLAAAGGAERSAPRAPAPR